MKQMMTYASPFDFGALRYLGGAGVLFVALILTRQPLAPPPWLPTLVVGLMQTTAFQALAQLALLSGGAGKVSLLCYTMPFWVVLLAWFVLNEKPQATHWAGLVLASIGLFLVISPWQNLGTLSSLLLAVGGGLAWAIGTVSSKWVFQRYALTPLNFTAWQMLLGALALSLLAAVVPSPAIVWSREFVFGLAYSIFLASSLAWLLWAYLVRVLPTAVVGLASLLVPLTAILLAWIILHERPNLIEGSGIALIMLALFIVRPSSNKPKHG